MFGDVERDIDLIEQALEPREAVALRAYDDPQHLRRYLAVSEVWLVAAQVEVDARRPSNGPGDAVGLSKLRAQHAHAARARPEDVVAPHQGVDVVAHAPPYQPGDAAGAGGAAPAGGPPPTPPPG